MTIEEAIDHLSSMAQPENVNLTQQDVDALVLGIGALKRVKAIRDPKFPVMGEKLPGETE